MAEISNINEMHTPSHPGSEVRKVMNSLGLSINAFARKLDVSPATVHRLVTEKSAISPEMAIRLSMTVGQSALFWLQTQLGYDLWNARKRMNVERLQPLREKNNQQKTVGRKSRW